MFSSRKQITDGPSNGAGAPRIPFKNVKYRAPVPNLMQSTGYRPNLAHFLESRRRYGSARNARTIGLTHSERSMNVPWGVPGRMQRRASGSAR